MFDAATLSTFVVVVLGLFLIPGPAVLLVVTRTAQGGRSAGILTGLGIATGDFLHTLCAAMGLSAVLMTSAAAFSVVKLCGAAYLIYLGIRAFLAKPAHATFAAMPTVTPKRAYLQAILAEVLNPKTALFFLAFLPQFVHPNRGSSMVQFILLGLIFVGMSAVYTSLIAIAIRPLGRLVKRLAWLGRWQGKIIGTLFIALGIKVASQQRG